MMDLKLLKDFEIIERGSLLYIWANCAHLFPILLDMEKMPGEDTIDRSVKELLKPDDGISLSEERISQRALAAKKRSSNCKATLTFT